MGKDHTKRRETERQVYIKREKEVGRVQCFVKREDKSLIMYTMWLYRRNVLPSELTNTITQFIVYVHRN